MSYSDAGVRVFCITSRRLCSFPLPGGPPQAWTSFCRCVHIKDSPLLLSEKKNKTQVKIVTNSCGRASEALDQSAIACAM